VGRVTQLHCWFNLNFIVLRVLYRRSCLSSCTHVEVLSCILEFDDQWAIPVVILHSDMHIVGNGMINIIRGPQTSAWDGLLDFFLILKRDLIFLKQNKSSEGNCAPLECW